MGHDNRNPGAYVQRAVEQTSRYLTRIADENERLRCENAQKTAELDACRAIVATAAATSRENEYLKQQVVLLEERARTLEKLESDHAGEVATLRCRLLRQESQIAEVVDENRDYASQYREIEKLHGNLMNLYVAGYRLHSSFEREDVLSAITETVVNLIGSENFGVYESVDVTAQLDLVAWVGPDPCALRSLVLDDSELGALVRKGALHVSDSTNPLCAPNGMKFEILVPLRLGEQTTGAIIVFSLLPQKRDGLKDVDFELFDLLGAQAAGALYSTRLHEQVARGRQPQ